jgi:hypothetical protein
MWSEKDKKQREIDSAKAEITQAEALKVLLSNNTLAAEIHIAGMVMGTCDNKWLLPVVEKQIKELNKFLNGQPNLWE